MVVLHNQMQIIIIPSMAATSPFSICLLKLTS